MKPLVALGLILLSAGWMRAQVTVEVLTDQEQFLRDESLQLRLRISNRSGQALKLGQEKDWLIFDVKHLNGSSVDRLAEIPPIGEFELASGEAGSKTFDLMPYFDFNESGRYQVTATLLIKQWGTEVTSKPVTFEISRGSKVWEQDFGVPGSGEPPESRKYALVQSMYQKRLQLYLRISDTTENTTHKVIHLGPLVSFARPEAQIDAQSRVHVLFQSGGRLFIYHLIKPSGTVELRQFYDYTASRPRLTIDRKGLISVVGGQVRVTKQDIPPPPPEALIPTIPPELLAMTNAPAATNAPAGGKKKAKVKRSE
jgi:hypothetical protein